MTGLDHPGRGPADAEPLLTTLVDEGHLNADNADLLAGWFGRLRPAVEEAQQFRRFVHDDAGPTNVLVRDDTYAALIDWGTPGGETPPSTSATSRCAPFPRRSPGIARSRSPTATPPSPPASCGTSSWARCTTCAA